MGVPSFFRWLSLKYPKIISPVIEEIPQVVDGVTLPIDYSSPNQNGELDNLYLDMNGIVHPCSHPENKPPPETEDEIMLAIFEYTNRVLNMARPRKVLMIAVDGVAPRAKMNQQRARRFRSARDAKIENETREALLREREEMYGEIIEDSVKNKKKWDSNVITPGTPFMDKLAEALRYWISFKLATDPGWKNLQVIISDATVPGEGEHKIMNFVRSQRADPEYNPNTTHCIYGLDADLIFLGLATHEPHFKILREDVFAQDNNRRKRITVQSSLDLTEEEKQLITQQDSQKPFLWLHISVLREYLSAELFVPGLPFRFDLERAIDDWVFMCFFCGNDFLPHLPSLDVRENSIDILLDIWKTVLPKMKDYMTCDGELNLESVEILLQQLGSREADIFKTRHIQEIRKQEAIARRKSQKNMSKGQDRHPIVPNEHLQLYDTSGNLAKGSWNLTTHDMVTLKKELMLANEGNQEAIKIVQQKSNENDKLMEQISKEALNKTIDDANKNNLDNAAIMKKKLLAKKRALEVEEEEKEKNDNDENKIPNKLIKVSENEDDSRSKLNENILSEVVAEVENNDNSESTISSVPIVSNGDVVSGTIDTDEATRLFEPGFRERYYINKFHIREDEIESLRKDMVRCYIEGVYWVLKYYYQGCASWGWYYPYHYAPLASDFYGFSNLKIEFNESEPFLPFEQLMSVLPAASGHTLPTIFRSLMTNPESEIIDFYPEEFPIDMNGKKMSWHGIALLSFIDANRLLRVVRSKYKELTDEERSRNVRKEAILLISNKNINYEKFVNKIYENENQDNNEIHFKHFKSGLSGIVSIDQEGYKMNNKIKCPIESGTLPELSSNLILKMCYKMETIKNKNKSVILNGYIPPENMLSVYDLDSIRYKDNRNRGRNNYNRNWNFNEQMKQNVVPVGPHGTTQYKPRIGGYRSFYYFNTNNNNNQGIQNYNQQGYNNNNNKYQGNNNRSRYNGNNDYNRSSNTYRGGSRYSGNNNHRGRSRYQ